MYSVDHRLIKKRRLAAILCAFSAAWILLIFSWSLKPADISSNESSWVLSVAVKILPFLTEHLVRKAAHFTEFFVLGILLCAGCRAVFDAKAMAPAGCQKSPAIKGRTEPTLRVQKRSPAIAIAAGIGLITAICDELIQLGVPGRSCQITDMLLDFCGVLTGALIMAASLKVRQKGQKKVKPGP